MIICDRARPIARGGDSYVSAPFCMERVREKAPPWGHFRHFRRRFIAERDALFFGRGPAQCLVLIISLLLSERAFLYNASAKRGEMTHGPLRRLIINSIKFNYSTSLFTAGDSGDLPMALSRSGVDIDHFALYHRALLRCRVSRLHY